jgi:anti-anti-sigma factor
MKTKIIRSGDTVTISIAGHLSFESQEPLKSNLHRLIDEARTDSVAKKVIVNLENLEFVGSSGISSFVQTLKEFNAKSPVKPRYCHVKSEFQKVIRAFDDDRAFEFYDDEDRARRSYDN